MLEWSRENRIGIMRLAEWNVFLSVVEMPPLNERRWDYAYQMYLSFPYDWKEEGLVNFFPRRKAV